MDRVNVKDCSLAVTQLLISFSFSSYLFRSESSAPGGRGSGAGGGEPESAGHSRRTSDLCATPGAAGNREAKPGAGNHRPGEGEEAARERESAAPPAGN